MPRLDSVPATQREFDELKNCSREGWKLLGIELQRRFFLQIGVGNQASQQIDQEIERTTMAGMLDLTDILEMVINRLNNRPLAQQNLV